MASLPTRSFQTIVTNICSGIQGRASQLIDFSIGSPLRAIAEGFGGLFLWFQALVLKLQKAMRLSTASGTDVDTFVGDFQVFRLLAQPATGIVIFSRLSVGPTTAFIPVGTVVQTQDGIKYTVTANPTFVGFSAQLNGYTLAANTGAIQVPVQAVVAGSSGNVLANSIIQLASPVTGIDRVTNPASFLNGFDSEADTSLKNRFNAFMLGLSRGNFYGTEFAVLSAAITVQWQLVEDFDYAGNWRPGYYYVVVDDGSGAPSGAFMTALTNAVNSVRGLGIQAGTFPPVINYQTASMFIQTAPGYDHNTLAGLVAQTIENNINLLGLGQGLNWNILSSWAYTVTGVTGVSSVLLNGLSGDTASIAANPQITLKCLSAIVA